ncbi:MAG TPA: DUF4258 domain-containing protein [Candidatus Paceibacterota bacterium]|nr:DUF4258 domain-containing protein [Candidatus Paceibacterota bacterium]
MTSGSFVYLDHARDRMHQRGIAPSEVEEALSNGEPEAFDLDGMVRITGSASSRRNLRITRLEHFPVIVSVVEVEKEG